MSNIFKKAMDDILELVVKHKSFLEKNPKQLALLMNDYDEIHYASRFHKNKDLHDWDNLKYAVIDLEEVVSKKYANLVYDAWAANIEDEESSGHELEYKPNKTMDDFINMCLDPKYKYKSIYPNRKSVLNHLLCVIGNGYDWNKKGFLTKSHGPSGTEMETFWGFKKEKIAENIEKECYWLKNKEINEYRKIYLKSKSKKDKFPDLEKLEWILSKLDPKYAKKIEQEKKEQEAAPFYPLCDYSKIWTMPKNAHASYKEAAYEICTTILTDPKESKENKDMAKKIKKKHGLEE